MKLIGLFISIIWITIAVSVLLLNGIEPIKSLSPNEWGDVLAGLTAPLAFIWLVIGYFQQGEELKKNTEALRLQEIALNKQTEEIKNSVSHQSQMVQINQEELKITKKEVELKNKEESKKIKPDFIFRTISSQGGYEIGSKNKISIQNIGHNINHVHLIATDKYLSVDPTFIPIWYTGHSLEFLFTVSEYFDSYGESTFSIEYSNEAKEVWIHEYEILVDKDSGTLSFCTLKEWT